MEQRLQALELKLMAQEDLLDSLNTIVSAQQQQLDLLQQQLRWLYQNTERPQRADASGAAGAASAHELPPHY